MAAAYKPLVANAGFLRYWTALNATTKAEAEESANAYVDAEFSAWDRSSWSGGSVPMEVQQIAARIGSAEYIAREFLATNPEGGSQREGLPSTTALRQEAAALVGQAQSRGFLLGQDGARILPVSAAGRGSFNIRIGR